MWRLKGMGAKTYDIIRIELWLRRSDIGFAAFKKSLVSEFRKFKKRFDRKTSSSFDPRGKAVPSDRTKLNIARAMMGQGQKIFSPSPFSIDSIVAFYGLVRFAHGSIVPAMGDAISNIPLLALANERLPGLHGFLTQGFRGIVGSTDEIDSATEQIIRLNDEAIFSDARQLTNLLPWMVSHTPDLYEVLENESGSKNITLLTLCSSIAAGLRHGYLRMHTLIVVSKLMHDNPEWRKFAVWLSSAAIPALQEMIAFTRNNQQIQVALGSENPLALLLPFLPLGFWGNIATQTQQSQIRELLRDHGMNAFLEALQNRPDFNDKKC